jgi:nucleotide-binding universal stress UspA family protein
VFESILVPVDGSPAAEAALAMAARIPSDQMQLILVQPDTTSLDGVCRTARDGRAYLEGLAAPLRRLGRTVETRVLFGDAGRQIVAASAMADLVVMGSRGCGATYALVLGSVASWVATHAPVPAMIVRGGDGLAAASAFDRIVVALDGSPLAESAIPVAERLASELGLPIHLVRVLDFDPIRAAVQAGPDAAAAWSVSMEETIQQAQHYLAAHAAHLQERGFMASHELRKGLPVD